VGYLLLIALVTF